MSSELAPQELVLDESYRYNFIQRTDELINYFQSQKSTLRKTKVYKKICTQRIYDVSDSKIYGIEGDVIIEGKTLEEVCAVMLKCAGDITEGSPKQLLKMMVFQRIYFWSDEAKKAYEDILAGRGISDFEFYAHGCGRSPAQAIVKHRDYIAIGRLFRRGDVVYMLRASVPSDDNQIANVVRSNLHVNCFSAEKLPDGKIKISNMVHVDPCGSIPSNIVNIGLNMALDVLLLIYNVLLNIQTFEYE